MVDIDAIHKRENMSFRRAAKVDDNQTEIVKYLRKTGWYVLIVSQLKNCCDLIASKNGQTYAIEVKDGRKPPSARKLSEGEQRFKDEWKGRYKLIESLQDAESLNAAQK